MTDGREFDGQAVYQIRVQGRLDERWSDWFNGMAITFESQSDGSTVTTLIGVVVDQAALHGILSKVRDLNLILISVTKVQTEKTESHPYRGGK